MSWQQFIDGYDCKARLIPTLIVLLPLFWTAYYFYPAIVRNPLLLTGSGAISVALIYVASMLVKDLGVRYALRFWKNRGGLPSTRMGRMRDAFLSSEQKERMRAFVRRRLGIELLSLGAELENPLLADRKIIVCFREIKELLRQSAKGDLVEKHNAEYGFARNLCGSRMIFVVFAIAGSVACGFKDSWPKWTFTSGSLVNSVFLVLWIPFAWLILPRMMKLNAETYAGRAWMTFLSLSSELPKKPSAFVGVDDRDRNCG